MQRNESDDAEHMTDGRQSGCSVMLLLLLLQ